MSSLTNFNPLKGFRDFLGSEARKRFWLIQKMRSVYERYGFEPLETPTLEYEALLLGKYGEEAEKLIYRFEDNGARRVALRYDQTVPTARVIAAYNNKLNIPYKRYQIQPVWRADKPQKGRYREFYQSDADVIGSTSPLADAEILAVYYAIYQEIGLTTLKIKINDRKTLIKTILDEGIGEEKIFSVIQTIDKLDKKSTEEVKKELIEKGLSDTQTDNLLQTLKNLPVPEDLLTIISFAQQLGVPKEAIEFTPTLARGLDYYTGMIFEGIIPEYPVGSVGGGGRYDKLLDSLVGVDKPAVGFGIGFDRTLEAAETLKKIPEMTSNADILITVFSPELLPESLKLTKTLRAGGAKVDISIDYEKKMDKQLKYANKNNIPYVAFIGPEEVKNGTIKLKSMATGQQTSFKLEETPEELKKKN